MEDPEITVDEAYYIKLETIGNKLAEGQIIVGKKMLGVMSLTMDIY